MAVHAHNVVRLLRNHLPKNVHLGTALGRRRGSWHLPVGVNVAQVVLPDQQVSVLWLHSFALCNR